MTIDVTLRPLEPSDLADLDWSGGPEHLTAIAEVLPLMVDLSLRVKDGNVRSVVFKHGVDGFSSPNPDFALMRKRVKAALKETRTEAPSPSPSSTKKKSGSPKPSSSGDGKASEDVADSCAFQPSVAATAQPAR